MVKDLNINKSRLELREVHHLSDQRLVPNWIESSVDMLGLYLFFVGKFELKEWIRGVRIHRNQFPTPETVHLDSAFYPVGFHMLVQCFDDCRVVLCIRGAFGLEFDLQVDKPEFPVLILKRLFSFELHDFVKCVSLLVF